MSFFGPRTKPLGKLAFFGVLGVVVNSFAPPLAQAKPNGVGALTCSSCHPGGQEATVKLVPSTMAPALGEKVRLTVTVEKSGSRAGGFFLANERDIGSFALVSGQGTRPEGFGVTHASPKSATGGKTTFLIDWVAPNTTDYVVFELAGTSSNLDNKAAGEATGTDRIALAVGCNGGTQFWRDFDGDGFGLDDADTIAACTRPEGYADKKGDCDDNEPESSPEGTEVCNGRDDDCDGEIDVGPNLCAAGQVCRDRRCEGGSGTGGQGAGGSTGQGGAGGQSTGGSGGQGGATGQNMGGSGGRGGTGGQTAGSGGRGGSGGSNVGGRGGAGGGMGSDDMGSDDEENEPEDEGSRGGCQFGGGGAPPASLLLTVGLAVLLLRRRRRSRR